MTDDELRAAITKALSGATPRPLDVAVIFNEIGDVFARVDMSDENLHWSQNVDLDDLAAEIPVEYHPREEVERDVDWYCRSLARNFAAALAKHS